MNYATLNQFFKWCPKEAILEHRKSENCIYLVSGARIIYLTADNERHIDRLRGIEIGGYWADEATLFLPNFWRVLAGRLRDSNGPLAGIITTTPKGFDYVYYTFVKKVDFFTRKPFVNPEIYEWFSGSTLDNPFTPQEYKDTLLTQYAGKFKDQEIFGKFVGFEGAVYDLFNHRVHIVKKADMPKEFKRVIIGLDIGFTNPMAGLVIGFDGDDRAYLIEEFYQRRVGTETIAAWLKEKCTEYEVEMIYVDPSEPRIIDELGREGLIVTSANNSVMPGINFVYPMFSTQEDGKPRIYISEVCSNTIEEISNYRYGDKKFGKEEKENPLKVDDHLMDAMRYGIFSHLGNEGTVTLLTDPDGVLF